MKITSVRAIPVMHPDHNGTPLHFLFVRIETDNGIVGYGEVSDGYGCRYPSIQKAVIDDVLAPLVMAEEFDSVDRLTRIMLTHVRRRPGDRGPCPHAIAGLEIAMWDAWGKFHEKSISTLIGGWRREIPVYASGLFLQEREAQGHFDLFKPFLDRGVSTVKVRTAMEWRDDLVKLAELRQLLGDRVEIFIDGTENYSAPAALRLAQKFAELGVVIFEEPIPQEDEKALAWLVQKSPIFTSYGEGYSSRAEFENAMQRGTMNVATPDPATCGGISETLAVARSAELHAIPIIPHSAAGPMALAAALHVCSASHNAPLIEYCFTLDSIREALMKDLILAPSRIQDGQIPVPEGPGLGLEIDDEALRHYAYEAPQPYPGMSTWTLGSVW